MAQSHTTGAVDVVGNSSWRTEPEAGVWVMDGEVSVGGPRDWRRERESIEGEGRGSGTLEDPESVERKGVDSIFADVGEFATREDEATAVGVEGAVADTDGTGGRCC
jgi:hypothetical protein